MNDFLSQSGRGWGWGWGWGWAVTFTPFQTGVDDKKDTVFLQLGYFG
jgi:hypothetical protein